MRTIDEIQGDARDAHQRKRVAEDALRALLAQLAGWRTKKAIESDIKREREEIGKANARLDELRDEWADAMEKDGEAPSAEPGE